MAIKAYLGRMGSGKTYEVVSVVILAAVARGRRVVTNIAGLNIQAMVELLVSEGHDAAKLGTVVVVSHLEVLQPNFWRTDKDGELGIEATIQPGDLVALDEIWRFWEGFAARNMPERVMNFFRMHRHFTHPETGVACDVALITQDIGDIARRVRAVIEECYRMEKLTAVGAAKRYRVDVFQGGKIVRKPLRSIQRSYDPKFFPLYKSHSQAKEGGAGPVEENIDGRGNLLKGVLFKIILPLSIPVFIFAVWSVWSFLHPKDPKATASPAKGSEPAKPGEQAKSGATVPAPAPKLEMADSWRVVGYYTVGDSVRVALSNGHAMRYLVDPPKYRVAALSVNVELPEGGFATTYTGTNGSAGLIPGGEGRR